jgi:hypothetical protein
VLQVNSSAFIPNTTTKQDATDFDTLGCVKIETGTVGMGNQPALVIGEPGDILQIKGATLLGSLLVGNGVNTETLPVGANGLVLKANSNSLTGLGVEWAVDGTSGITGVSAGANISIDNSNPLVPAISVADPLTSQLNIGSQTIVGATTALTETTTLDINANSAVAGLVELDFNDVASKSISAFNNIRISNIEAGAVMKFDTNDTGTGEIKTALKEETIKENEHQISIAIVDTGGITNGEITRTIITSGDDTGCEDTITSTDNTNNRVALRKEETDWANGIVDTSTYTNAFITNTTTSRVEIANNTEVSDTLSFTNGIQTGSYLNKATNSSSRVDLGFTNTSGVGSTTSLLCDITQGQHTISYDGGATLLNSITNTTDTNRSRSEVRLSDSTINQRNRIDATGLSCSYEQFSQNIVGASNTASLSTNATTPATTLTTDAPLYLETTAGSAFLNATAGININAGAIGSNTAPVVISNSGAGGQLNPLMTLTNTNATGSVALEVYKNKPTAVVNGDVLFNQSVYGKDSGNNKQEYTRITHAIRDNISGTEDGSIEFSAFRAGAVNTFLQINGVDNEVNCLKNLDMGGNSVITNTGDMTISTTTSTGTGLITMSAKADVDITGTSCAVQSVSGGNIGALYTNPGVVELEATNTLTFTGVGLQAPTAGGNSGEYLVITLNAVQYKIALLNP